MRVSKDYSLITYINQEGQKREIKPSDEQRKIITSDIDEDQKIIACAGSGKTTTVVIRILYLLAEKGISPDSIIVSTFNKDAGSNLKQKAKEIIGVESELMLIGNIDRLAYRFYQMYIVQNEKKSSDMQLSVKEYCYKLKQYLETKEGQDNILSKYKYFFFDEFQDVSELQYEILMLFKNSGCIIVAIGDDAQNIYSWRNSKIQLIQTQIDQDIKRISGKEIHTYMLSTNYRCQYHITEFSNQIVANSRYLLKKQMNSIHKQRGGHLLKRPHINLYNGRWDQIDRIISDIKYLTVKNYSLNDIAVLSPTNSSLRKFEEKLEQNNNSLDLRIQNIPYSCKDPKQNDFYQISENDKPEQKEAKLTLSTIHSAKGLEWKIVFLIGINDTYFPGDFLSQYGSSVKRLEECKRLFYVGCTRAIEELRFSVTKPKKTKNPNPIVCRFFSDINPKYYTKDDSLMESDFAKDSICKLNMFNIPNAESLFFYLILETTFKRLELQTHVTKIIEQFDHLDHSQVEQYFEGVKFIENKQIHAKTAINYDFISNHRLFLDLGNYVDLLLQRRVAEEFKDLNGFSSKHADTALYSMTWENKKSQILNKYSYFFENKNLQLKELDDDDDFIFSLRMSNPDKLKQSIKIKEEDEKILIQIFNEIKDYLENNNIEYSQITHLLLEDKKDKAPEYFPEDIDIQKYRDSYSNFCNNTKKTEEILNDIYNVSKCSLLVNFIRKSLYRTDLQILNPPDLLNNISDFIQYLKGLNFSTVEVKKGVYDMNIRGEIDLIADDTIFEFKASSSNQISKEYILQALAYAALLKVQNKKQVNYITYYNPIKGNIYRYDITMWDQQEQFIKFLIQKTVEKAIQQQKESQTQQVVNAEEQKIEENQVEEEEKFESEKFQKEQNDLQQYQNQIEQIQIRQIQENQIDRQINIEQMQIEQCIILPQTKNQLEIPKVNPNNSENHQSTLQIIDPSDLFIKQIQQSEQILQIQYIQQIQEINNVQNNQQNLQIIRSTHNIENIEQNNSVSENMDIEEEAKLQKEKDLLQSQENEIQHDQSETHGKINNNISCQHVENKLQNKDQEFDQMMLLFESMQKKNIQKLNPSNNNLQIDSKASSQSFNLMQYEEENHLFSNQKRNQLNELSNRISHNSVQDIFVEEEQNKNNNIQQVECIQKESSKSEFVEYDPESNKQQIECYQDNLQKSELVQLNQQSNEEIQTIKQDSAIQGESIQIIQQSYLVNNDLNTTQIKQIQIEEQLSSQEQNIQNNITNKINNSLKEKQQSFHLQSPKSFHQIIQDDDQMFQQELKEYKEFQETTCYRSQHIIKGNHMKTIQSKMLKENSNNWSKDDDANLEQLQTKLIYKHSNINSPQFNFNSGEYYSNNFNIQNNNNIINNNLFSERLDDEEIINNKKSNHSDKFNMATNSKLISDHASEMNEESKRNYEEQQTEVNYEKDKYNTKNSYETKQRHREDLQNQNHRSFDRDQQKNSHFKDFVIDNKDNQNIKNNIQDQQQVSQVYNIAQNQYFISQNEFQNNKYDQIQQVLKGNQQTEFNPTQIQNLIETLLANQQKNLINQQQNISDVNQYSAISRAQQQENLFQNLIDDNIPHPPSKQEQQRQTSQQINNSDMNNQNIKYTQENINEIPTYTCLDNLIDIEESKTIHDLSKSLEYNNNVSNSTHKNDGNISGSSKKEKRDLVSPEPQNNLSQQRSLKQQQKLKINNEGNSIESIVIESGDSHTLTIKFQNKFNKRKSSSSVDHLENEIRLEQQEETNYQLTPKKLKIEQTYDVSPYIFEEIMDLFKLFIIIVITFLIFRYPKSR